MRGNTLKKCPVDEIRVVVVEARLALVTNARPGLKRDAEALDVVGRVGLLRVLQAVRNTFISAVVGFPGLGGVGREDVQSRRG